MPETPWKTSKMKGMDETPGCTCGTCQAKRERRLIKAMCNQLDLWLRGYPMTRERRTIVESLIAAAGNLP